MLEKMKVLEEKARRLLLSLEEQKAMSAMTKNQLDKLSLEAGYLRQENQQVQKLLDQNRAMSEKERLIKGRLERMIENLSRQKV